MAAGKSTVGPLLADQLGYRFVDLDWLVEARTGQSIPDLFRQGEPVFRAAEADALAETTRGTGLVVATGGGTLAEARSLAHARMAGAIVWLRVPPEIVEVRVGAAQGRPLLAGALGTPLQGDALAARIRALIAAREPFYAQADLAVDAHGPPDATARQIAEQLRGWRRGPAVGPVP